MSEFQKLQKYALERSRLIREIHKKAVDSQEVVWILWEKFPFDEPNYLVGIFTDEAVAISYRDQLNKHQDFKSYYVEHEELI